MRYLYLGLRVGRGPMLAPDLKTVHICLFGLIKGKWQSQRQSHWQTLWQTENAEIVNASPRLGVCICHLPLCLSVWLSGWCWDSLSLNVSLISPDREANGKCEFSIQGKNNSPIRGKHNDTTLYVGEVADREDTSLLNHNSWKGSK